MGKNIKVCLVGSSGGHLTHLYQLKTFWESKNRFWVTFNKEDANSLLKDEKVYHCYFPTNKSIIDKYCNCMEGVKKRKTGFDYFNWCCSCCSVFLFRKIIWSKDNLY